MKGTYSWGPLPTPPVGTPIKWGGPDGKRVGTVIGGGPGGQFTFEIDDEEALAALGVPRVFQGGETYSVKVPGISTSADGAVLIPPECGKRGFAGEHGCKRQALHEGPCRYLPYPPPAAMRRETCVYCLVQQGRHASCGKADCSCRDC
jgi:hypothetical protein